MPEALASIDVRHATGAVRVIDIQGDIAAASEGVLMDAYGRASVAGVNAIVLNLSALAYMNGAGIGLLVTLLGRAQRQDQRLLAYGLSEHYRQIFALTRLDCVVSVHDSEDAALSAAAAPGAATTRVSSAVRSP